MNNALMMLAQALQGGANPIQLLSQMGGGNNSMISQATSMLAGKSPQQLRQMAENMCRERGMTLQQAASQFGLNLPL
nr:MAG TPA: helix-turn-helix, Psq domain [Caudoviricetes sp.]